jgi:heme-degrading monooxygenase HmoA
MCRWGIDFKLKAARNHLRISNSPFAHLKIIRTSAHLHICTSAHLHICTSAHPHIRTFAHPHIRTSAHPHIRTSTHPHIHTSSHLHIWTFTYLHVKNMIAKTPRPPYYAVIFTSLRTDGDNGYGAMAEEMNELAAQQPGCLGFESAREGLGITVSYWQTLEDIKNWKANTRHLVAQKTGREKWYEEYKVRICKVERDYGF